MSEGGVILYPTDTIWGIGCDATNEEAVRRVYEIKQRSDSKAMLVLVDSPVKVDFYVQDVPEVAWDLIELADKPLTIIYSGARNLAPNLLAEDGSVGIRVTSEAFSKRLCHPHAVKLPQLGKAPLTPRAFRLFPRPQNHSGRKRRSMTISEAKQDGHRRMGLLRAGKTSKPLSL